MARNDFTTADDCQVKSGYVRIISIEHDEANKSVLQLHKEVLEKILTHENIRNLPVTVVAFAGGPRGGKSCLANLLLKYLSTESTPLVEAESGSFWLDEGGFHSVIDGFSRDSRAESPTAAICAWSRPLRLMGRDGSDCAVLILDIQGLTDMTSTHDTTLLFALSTMLSSVLVYNVRGGQIGSDLLEQMNMFVEYARTAVSDESAMDTAKPFQSLVVVVRDWQYPQELPYGNDGGQMYLNKRLNIDGTGGGYAKGTLEICKNLQTCFTSISCSLLPHPGECVAEPNFADFSSQLSPRFRTEVVKFIEWLANLAAYRLLEQPKATGDKPVTCKEMLNVVESHVSRINQLSQVTIKSLSNATRESFDRAAVEAAVKNYGLIMDRKLGFADNNANLVRTTSARTSFETLDQEVVGEIMKTFDSRKCGGGSDNIRATIQEALYVQGIRYRQLNVASEMENDLGMKRLEDEIRRQDSVFYRACSLSWRVLMAPVLVSLYILRILWNCLKW